MNLLLTCNRVLRANTVFTLICVFMVAVFLFEYDFYTYSSQRTSCDNHNSHSYTIENYYKRRKYWKTSNLGSVLFKNIDPKVFQHATRENRTFVVLIWKHWDWLMHRHVQTFNKSSRVEDPLDGCSVHNCIFSGDDKDLSPADAVVVHVQKGMFPKVDIRNPSQRWVFLSDESPIHTFSLASKKPSLSSLANMFNWTMTYRSDSDIPVPYGRTVPLKDSIIQDIEPEKDLLIGLVPNWNNKRSDVLAAVLMSNCGVKPRMKFLNKLQKYMKVDVHGKCSTTKLRNSCPGHFKSDCKVISEYLFYLVLENSKCRHYLTEKAFYNAYSRGAIPVIMGPPLSDCEKLLPPNSFLHVDNYKTVADLALDMKRISHNDVLLLSFHKWRNNFQIVNEHGYFGGRSYHYCRICEALNYNDGEISIYDEDDLKLFFDPTITCTT